MRDRPNSRPVPESDLSLIAWNRPSVSRYRMLFRRVGGPWLWFSRLVMDDAQLLDVIHDPAVSIFAAVDRRGVEVGMLELDHRRRGECELSYLALAPELTGSGRGRWLMAHALEHAWRRDTQRVWVHTCTLDHPSALNFYRAQGFAAIARTVETFVDPRTLGILPADAASHIPLLVRPTNER